MRLLREYLRPYRAAVVLAVVFTFAQTMSSLYLPNLMSNIVDSGVVHGNVGYIIGVGLWMLVVTAFGGGAAVLSSYFAARAMAGMGQHLRLRLFSHVTHYSLSEFDRLSTSSLIVRNTNDVTQIQQMVYMLLRMMVMAPLSAIGGIVLAVHMDARLSLILVVVLPVMGIAIYLIMSSGVGLFQTMQRKIDRLNLVLRENLTGVRVVRSFGRVPYEERRFDGANGDLTDTSVRVFQLMATLMPLVMLIMNLSTVAIVWFGARQINGLSLQIGQLMAFIQYVTQIMFSVMMGSMMFFMVPRAQASAQRIAEALGLRPDVTDPERPVSAQAGPGRVTFEHVTFRYPGAEAPALEDINFTAEPGGVTAIIGGTGAGKSTLLHLLLRFYDPEAGRIRIDGTDIREMSQAQLRARLAYVPQRTILFEGSVLDNIRFGDERATEAAARRAAEIAQAAEFIDSLPDGMGANVEQGGMNLSGGQRQRLAIARAVVRKASAYLFDDSFSALDYRTDALLRIALRREMGHATLLVVAQRVSTVLDADRILVLDEGRLVGVGTHHELMAECDVYREIVASQLSPEEVA